MEFRLKVRLEIRLQVAFISIGVEVSTRHRPGVQLRVLLGLGVGWGGVEQVKAGLDQSEVTG